MTDTFTPRWWNQSSNRPGMYQRIRVFDVVDFTGGLNLATDAFKLAPNESPEMMNIDVDRRGGFQVRRGVAPYTTSTLTADPKNIWSYISGATKYIVAQVGTDLKASTGGAWSNIGTSSGSATETCRAATFNFKNYVVRGDASVVKWDGSTATTMTSTFNDDILAPTSGNVPRAKLITAHSGYMWVANTIESGTAHTCRVRWSHPNNPENWRTDDYIDIDIGKDGDQITALMPVGDHLLVCKRDSLYAIYGYDFNTFSVVNISNTIGCVSQEACANTQMGVAVFDHNLGVHMYGGKNSVQWEFSQIYPALRDNQIPQDQVDNVQMGWLNGRLWVGTPWFESSTVRGTTFVWSPMAKQGGSWTRYDLPTGPFLSGHMLNEYCCAILGTNRVMAIDQEEWGDDFGSGTLSVINAFYRTKWFDAGQASMKKRWRRMEAVMQAEYPYELPVTVHFDFDPNSVSKTFKLKTSTLNAASNDAYWGDSTIRTTDTNWGTDDAAVGAGEGIYSELGVHSAVDRGNGLGLCKSVCLTIGGPVTKTGTTDVPVFWGIDALVFKFVPRRIR